MLMVSTTRLCVPPHSTEQRVSSLYICMLTRCLCLSSFVYPQPVVCLPPHDQIGGWAAYAYDALQPWLAWAYNNNPTSHTHSHTDSSSNTHSHTVNEDQAVAAPANAAERSGRTSLPGCVVRAAGGQQTDRDPAVPAPPSSVMGPHACQCSGGVVLAAGGQPWDSASPSEPHTASAEGVSRPPSVSVLRSGASPSEPHTVPDASARHTESTAAVSRRPGAPSPLKHANVSAAEVMSQPDSAAGISACVGVEAGTGVSECAGTSERHASEAVCTVQASSVCSGVQSVCEDSDKELTTGQHTCTHMPAHIHTHTHTHTPVHQHFLTLLCLTAHTHTHTHTHTSIFICRT